MRESLHSIVDRARYFGTFARYGSKKNRSKGLVSTVLLENITDEAGREICDHLWLDFNDEFAALGLRKGETISFEATVSTYFRGYQGWNASKVEFDYQLTNPSNIRREPRTPK